jgi:hypothetical protein
MCSFDPNTLNWANSYIFENSPRFLNLLSQEVVRLDIKPEFEVFDTGHLDSVMYYVKKWNIPQPIHIPFIMGVGGSMPASALNLAFLESKLPEGATWSVSGIGAKAHMPMMLAGLALGCDGLRAVLKTTSICQRALSQPISSSFSAQLNLLRSRAAKSLRRTTQEKSSVLHATACATERQAK